jgi:hypothetical protein
LVVETEEAPMPYRLTGQATYCKWRAAVCRRKAAAADTEVMRSQYRAMAAHWEGLACNYETAERISGFLQWDAQRLKAPEAFQS